MSNSPARSDPETDVAVVAIIKWQHVEKMLQTAGLSFIIKKCITA